MGRLADDLATFGREVTRLLQSPDAARRLGEAAHDRVRAEFLPPHHFAREADLVGRLLAA